MMKIVAALALGFWATTAPAGTVEPPLQIGGAFHVPVTSLQERRYAGTVHQRYDFSCGSAALATLLTHHYGHPVTEDEVADAMLASGDVERIGRDGFSLLDMKRALEALGFEADGYREPLDRLTEAGLPAIALLAERGYHHFVVVKGLRDGRVLIGDPARGTRTLDRAAFERAWANGILFVIGNRREAAVFNSASEWARAPASPLADAIGRDGLAGIAMPRLGPADF